MQARKTTSRAGRSDDGSLADLRRRLLKWYDANRRDLPWRVERGSLRGALPPPYFVFVSEAMLQQTQVATVIPYFHRFIAQFPKFESLASADQQEVLRAWQGLGYYSRARNLQAAAKMVVDQFAGKLPSTVDELLTLPGVGRYTAGAIASLAFDQHAPILDGNVARVVCRIEAITDDPRTPKTIATLWTHAETLLPATRTGDFNSALMELGATVCTPRSPQCLICPIASHCEAFRLGKQDQIPPPRVRKESPLHRRLTICLQNSKGRWLIEQRPQTGRWAGLWQFVTFENDRIKEGLDGAGITSVLGIPVDNVRPLGKVRHALTHRRYEFTAIAADSCDESADRVAEARPNSRWISVSELDEYPLSKPQLAISRMLVSTS